MQPQFRSSAHEIGEFAGGHARRTADSVERSSRPSRQGNGASFIYRENNSRYIGVQYSIEGRDLERAVRDGQAAVQQAVTLPQGYRMTWGGEYSQFLEARAQMYFIVPLAIGLIFMILFALYGNFKFPITIASGCDHDGTGGGAGRAEAHRTRRSASRPCWACWHCWAFRWKPPSFWFHTSTS